MRKKAARTTLIMAFIAAFGFLSLSARAEQGSFDEIMMINTEGKIAAAMFNFLDAELERSAALLDLEITRIDTHGSDLMEGKIQATLINEVERRINQAGLDLEQAVTLEALDKVQAEIQTINRLISEINL